MADQADGERASFPAMTATFRNSDPQHRQGQKEFHIRALVLRAKYTARAGAVKGMMSGDCPQVRPILAYRQSAGEPGGVETLVVDGMCYNRARSSRKSARRTPRCSAHWSRYSFIAARARCGHLARVCCSRACRPDRRSRGEAFAVFNDLNRLLRRQMLHPFCLAGVTPNAGRSDMRTCSWFRSAVSILSLAALAAIVAASQPTRAAGPWYVAPDGDDAPPAIAPPRPAPRSTARSTGRLLPMATPSSWPRAPTPAPVTRWCWWSAAPCSPAGGTAPTPPRRASPPWMARGPGWGSVWPAARRCASSASLPNVARGF